MIVGSVPSGRPQWAVLERELFAAASRAAELMSRTYSAEDGSMRFSGTVGGLPDDRDGVDDFYESFSNWGQFYLLGGGRAILDAARWHWHGLTKQLGSLGMLTDEYERAYDWFHQGESFEMFGFLCAADPDDDGLATRARRFARLYTDPSRGNFDPEQGIIRAPHTGSEGPKYGFTGGEPYFPWSEDFILYGLPLDWVGVPDVETAFADPAAGRLLGREMWERMSRGDTAINLAATSLVMNAALLDEPGAAEWVRAYTDRWARAVTDEGILADSIGLDGQVGEYLEGRWYGGHYGWSWPHGLHSVGTALLVAVQNQAVLGGPNPLLDIARSTLDQVIARRKMVLPSESDGSMAHRWTMKWTDPEQPSVMVPYRRGDVGWHDYMPMQTALPTALWHLTGDPADLERLRVLELESSYSWAQWFGFKDKEDAGHEEPWLVFLRGENPSYPEAALQFALDECRRREALMTPEDAEGITDFNHWQHRNPISTEALVQLTLARRRPSITVASCRPGCGTGIPYVDAPVCPRA